MLSQIINKSKIPPGITHVAGSPNSGTTTLLYQLCKGIKKEQKAIIFDCEMSFSAKRLKEIILDTKTNLQDIYVIRIMDKKQQVKILMKLHNFLKNNEYSFMAINGITDHFRFNNKLKSERHTHRILALQMAYLKMLSKKQNLPIIITNQVSMFRDNEKQKIRPIANAIISNYSDRTIIFQYINKRLWKAKYNDEELFYSLSSKGIEETLGSF
jgi:RecA/RadA recombinase